MRYPLIKVRIQQEHKLKNVYKMMEIEQCSFASHADKEEIKKIINNFTETKSTTYPNLWETRKTVLSGEFIALKCYIEEMENSHW